MLKKKYYKKIDKGKIDAEFHRRWSNIGCQFDRDALADYIRDSYFPLLYAFAAKLLSSMAGSQKYEDAVSSLVIDVMEDVIGSTRDNNLGYRGSSSFSSYLFSALRNKHREKSKLYYPSEVQRHGMAAKHAYRLLLVERFSSLEVKRILQENYEIEGPNLGEIMALVRSYEMDESVRRRDRGEFNEDDSMDRLQEENPYGAPHNSSSAIADYLRQSEIDLLYRSLSRLEEPAQTILRGYMLEERWSSLAEMEEELGLKNGSYELKKAKKQLGELMEAAGDSHPKRAGDHIPRILE